MRFKKKLILAIAWIVLVSFLFNKYAYEIFEFNTSTRVFIKEGKISHREFDNNGLPISYSARIGEYQSPFYVVHYAILYSENISEKPGYISKIWFEDSSLKYWNVYPNLDNKNNNKIYFKNSVDWLVENVDYSVNGKAHYLYNFDWPYKGYPDQVLKKGWWSGLTDAYAIIPLLRAYEIFGDDKYLKVASDLYQSSLTSYKNGGSFTYLDGLPWIEEYVDPRVGSESKFPYVFNGMVYATYGIQAYESLSLNDSKKISPFLFDSIANNIHYFNHNGWSYYDLYNNSNNIKYHLVHKSLLDDLRSKYFKKGNALIDSIFDQWEKTSDNLGLNYFLYGNRVFAYYHFLFLYFAFIFLGCVILWRVRSK